MKNKKLFIISISLLLVSNILVFSGCQNENQYANQEKISERATETYPSSQATSVGKEFTATTEETTKLATQPTTKVTQITTKNTQPTTAKTVKANVPYYKLEGYKQYINDGDTYCKTVEYFGVDSTMECSKKARLYYQKNVRQVGDYLITDYKDGICINRYVGKVKKKIVIPEKIEGKPVIKLGEFLVYDKWEDNGKIRKTPCAFGPFGGVFKSGGINIEIPSTVKYISKDTLRKWHDAMSEIDENNSNNIATVTISKNNPYYCSDDVAVYSKDKKTLLYWNVLSTHYTQDEKLGGVADEFCVVPSCVENYEPLVNQEVDYLDYIVFDKNIKSINAKPTWMDVLYTDMGECEKVYKIIGYKGTIAEKYAKKYKLDFISIEDNPSWDDGLKKM